MAHRLRRELLTLRGLLFVLLGVLALAVAALLLAMFATQPATPVPATGRGRAPAAPAEPPSGLLSEDVAPEATDPGRRPLVRLPPRPPPAQLQAVEMLPINMVDDPNLQAFLREADQMFSALDPATSYLGMLAIQALRDETSRLRVMAESGGAAAALSEVRPVRGTSELPADAQTLALLLRSILVSSASGQQSLLDSSAGQPAITERIQQAREARALGRFVEVHDALEFGAELRNHMVLSTSIDRP